MCTKHLPYLLGTPSALKCGAKEAATKSEETVMNLHSQYGGLSHSGHSSLFADTLCSATQ